MPSRSKGLGAGAPLQGGPSLEFDLGFRAQGSGFRVQGLGFRV